MSDKSCKRICLILALTGLAVVFTACVFLTEHDAPLLVSGNGRSAYNRIEPVRIPGGGNVKINTNDPESLIVLPGIGKSIAGLISDEFLKNGPYYYPEDLMAVKGIGKKKLLTILPDISLAVSEEERIR